MALSLIVAVSTNGVIGHRNTLPWRLAGELQYFRRTTARGVVIMGRKTYESMGRALPDRVNIVLSRTAGLRLSDARVASSLAEALRWARQWAPQSEIFVIGGSSVYQEALPLVTKLYLTRVHAHVEGDAYFPKTGWEGDFDVFSETFYDHEAIPYTVLVANRREFLPRRPST